MPTPPKPASSYDEIVRKTVPELDSSFRPTHGQEKAAYEGTRILDADEQQLHARVVDAVRGVGGIDPMAVTVEIDRDRVTLRGRVPDPSALSQLESRVHDVDGVGVVVNYVVIGTP
ncbi:MAG: BON domain-containing protein [Deltaproteobacteria bacterium]|nr:BON domain-containing protein [Deltaproteobacteria bacterium]